MGQAARVSRCLCASNFGGDNGDTPQGPLLARIWETLVKMALRSVVAAHPKPSVAAKQPLRPLTGGEKLELRDLYFASLMNPKANAMTSSSALLANRYVTGSAQTMRLTPEGVDVARAIVAENPLRKMGPNELALLRALDGGRILDLRRAAMAHGAGGPSAFGPLTRNDYIGYAPTNDPKNPLVIITAKGKAFLSALDAVGQEKESR